MRQRLTLKQQSFVISIVIHVAILMIAFPSVYRSSQIKDTSDIIQRKIPVELVLKTPPPPPPPAPVKKVVKKTTPKAPQTKKTVTIPKKTAPSEQQAETELTETAPPKPTSLPGDRPSPELVGDVSPIYPKSALNYGWTGEVSVEFIIGPDGRIVEYKIIESSGYPELDNAFIRAVESETFLPKRILGKDQQGSILLTHRFALD